ncbi:MAG: YARHG domain-containing protein [Blautia sp.]|nr:YARHG domain-containing protein [Blautia sp.]
MKIYHGVDNTEQFRKLMYVTRKNHDCGLAKVYGVRYMHGSTYVLEERVQGHTLREEIRRRHQAFADGGGAGIGIAHIGDGRRSSNEKYSREVLFLTDEIISISSHICSAVSILHENHVLHGDIRPENVMVQMDGHVKLIDYDNSILLDELGKKGQGRYPTLSYLAPEEELRMTESKDVYQIGVLIYELMYGWRDELLMFQRKANGPIEFPGRWPRPIDLVIDRCLSLNPGRRFKNADSLKKSLQSIVSIEEVWRGNIRRIMVALVAMALSVGILYHIGNGPQSGEMAAQSGAIAGFLLPDSVKRYLTEADLADMSWQVLNYAKNEIYARHGRIFQSRELAGYFSSQPWYHGTVASDEFDDEEDLSRMEQWNFQLIEQWENRVGKEQEPEIEDDYGYHLDSAGFSYSEPYRYLREHPENQIHIGEMEPVIGYILADSSERRLTEDEVKAMSLQVLSYARNELCAKHGRIFNNIELDAFFSMQPWYHGSIPSDQFKTKTMLSEIEMYNWRLLRRQDKNLARTIGMVRDDGVYGYVYAAKDYDYDPVYEYMASHGSSSGE